MLLPGGITHIAVVPVFFNVGAAALPSIIAGLASVIALILKPKELARLFKRKPHVPIILVLCAGGIFFLTTLASRLNSNANATSIENEKDVDWSKTALAIIESRRQKEAREQIESVSPIQDERSGLQSASIFRGYVSRSGYISGTSPLNLLQLWTFNEDDAMFLSSPMVRDNSLYGAWALLDNPNTYGAVFCLDAETGREKWIRDLKNDETEFKGFFSSPAISQDGSRLVIGQGLHADKNCELICIDTETGKINWLVETPLHIESSPAIEGNIVVVGAGAIEARDTHKPKGHPGYVLAVELISGKELWRYDLNDPESSPAIKNGIVYIGSGFNGNSVAALRTQPDARLKDQGLKRLLWQTSTPHPVVGAVTLTEDVVLVGCGNSDFVQIAANPQGSVLAMNINNGEILWEATMPDAVLGAISVHGDTAICPVRNGEVIAINLKKQGEIIWRTLVNNGEPVLAGTTFTRSHVYAVSKDGYLTVINAESGEVLETHYLNTPGKPGENGLSISSPIIANGRIFVGSETGGIKCFAGKESK